MAQAPKADPPLCDVPGCGALAETMTDGTEQDTHVRRVGKDGEGTNEPLNRKAVPSLNICATHHNWPFSDDAKAFAAAPSTATKYAARAAAASKGK
jgi:hypothetical protein